jgi:hypothetical protein
MMSASRAVNATRGSRPSACEHVRHEREGRQRLQRQLALVEGELVTLRHERDPVPLIDRQDLEVAEELA